VNLQNDALRGQAKSRSLAGWGPVLPHDFVHNYEVEFVASVNTESLNTIERAA
jgi:hypothetical protein